MDDELRVNRLAVTHEAEQYREPAAFVAGRQRATATAFRAAMRHSRRVRFARIAVPVVAILVIGAVFMATWLNPLRLIGNLPAGLRDVVISGTKVKMQQPRLSGFTRDARPYELSALSAAQDITKPDQIELTKLRAKIHMADDSKVELSAANGLFDTKAEKLTLEDDILVTSTSGYEGRLSHAVVNTRTGNIVSERPVTLKTRNGTINANAMEIDQAGQTVRFERGVSMLLMPNKDQGNTPAPAPPQ
jgi:lipopolysaccharide export system protein LptC